MIKKNYIKNALNEIYLFFIEIWIDKEDIFLWLQFDLNNKFLYINKELLLNVSLWINYKEWKYDRYFLYDKKQLKFLNKEINDEKFTVINNLFFKNYVIQSRFNRLISKKWLSINIGYFYNLNLKNKNYNWIKYFAQNVGFDLDTYIKQAISEKTDYKWKELKWRTNEKKQIALELIYMRIKDIKSIKEDYWKYIIWLNNSEINNYIPDIYKFNNFMIWWKNENKLTHYMIIFREINAMYIDNIDLSAVFSITNWTRLNVDYNSWIIKVLW